MNKRDYGEGSYVERSPGAWLITVPLGSDASGKRRRQRFTVKGNKAAAKKALRQEMAKRDNGFGVAPDRITTGEWLTRWLERHIASGKIGPRAADRYDGIVKKHLIPAIGAVKLQALRADQIDDLKTAWLNGTATTTDKPLSGGTVHKFLVILRQSFADALKKDVISRNPLDKVAAPSVKVSIERRALSEDEITTLVRASANTRYDVPIRFTLATGLREGELLAVRWSDVDLDRAMVTIERTLLYVGGKVQFAKPKSQRSKRSIELSAATVQLLRTHRAAQAEHRLKIGPLWQEHGLVFPSLIGTPWLPRAFYRSYRAVVNRAGLTDAGSVNWHALRHTAASQWLRHGADVYAVSRRLGHGSAAFTMDVYGHLLSGQQRHAAESLDYLIG